jgi:hypothetical protein
MTQETYPPWEFNARLLRWVDADTFDCEVVLREAISKTCPMYPSPYPPCLIQDLGFRIYLKHYDNGTSILTKKDRFRLVGEGGAGFNAWEVRGVQRPQGLLATDRAKELLPEGSDFDLFSYREQGKYGRWLASAMLENGEHVAFVLEAENHGEWKEY